MSGTCPLCMYYWGGVHCNAYPRGERRIPADVFEGRVLCDGTARHTHGFQFHANGAPPSGRRVPWRRYRGGNEREKDE